jgi:hypothetical protein
MVLNEMRCSPRHFIWPMLACFILVRPVARNQNLASLLAIRVYLGSNADTSAFVLITHCWAQAMFFTTMFIIAHAIQDPLGTDDDDYVR